MNSLDILHHLDLEARIRQLAYCYHTRNNILLNREMKEDGSHEDTMKCSRCGDVYTVITESLEDFTVKA